MTSAADGDVSTAHIHIPALQTTQKFIEALRSASLDSSNMDHEDALRLRTPNPNAHSLDVSDIHMVKAVRQFIATVLSSRQTYDDICSILLQTYPDDPFLSFNQVKRFISNVTGVNPIYHDMCCDSCSAFTGPYSELNVCPICAKPRYKLQASGATEPVQQFVTIPLGPVIQSLYGSSETAECMHYLEDRLQNIIEYAQSHNGRIPIYDDTAVGN